MWGGKGGNETNQCGRRAGGNQESYEVKLEEGEEILKILDDM